MEDALVGELIESGYLKTQTLIQAFRSVDRSYFVPAKFKEEAYVNEPLPIGYGQTISQPLVVAFMLEQLSPKPGEKILDIGSGSGWQTALLAYIVGEKGKVVAIERIGELMKIAKENISKYNFIKKGIVELIEGNALNGYSKEAPYDKIIAAASGGELPEAWKEQLKVGGVIVAPVKHNIVVVKKFTDEKFKETSYPGFSFVPLIKSED